MYAAIKQAMQTSGHPVSAGDQWTSGDASQFRDFAHFTLGVSHDVAHHIMSFPETFKDAVQKMAVSVGLVAMSSGAGEVDESDDAGEHLGGRSESQSDSEDGEPDGESDDAGEHLGGRAADDGEPDADDEPDESDDAGEHLGGRSAESQSTPDSDVDLEDEDLQKPIK